MNILYLLVWKIRWWGMHSPIRNGMLIIIVLHLLVVISHVILRNSWNLLLSTMLLRYMGQIFLLNFIELKIRLLLLIRVLTPMIILHITRPALISFEIIRLQMTRIREKCWLRMARSTIFLLICLKKRKNKQKLFLH